MLRGLYTAAAGMITQERKHDAITNNIANLNTPGFKRSVQPIRSFPEMLIARMGSNQQPGAVPMGRLNTGVLAEEDVNIFLQGDFEQTDNPYDFAISADLLLPTGNPDPNLTFDAAGRAISPDGSMIYRPQAFFTIVGPDGTENYTRNGKFIVNAAQNLMTSDGYNVLGLNGQPIIMRDNAQNPISDFRITSNGQFMDANGQPIVGPNGQPIGLLLTKVENPNMLLRQGNGLYRLDAASGAVAAAVNPAQDQLEVKQGYYEHSNVDPTQSVVDMMTAQRAYEANQKVIQYYDRSLDKAVNEVGRV